MEIIRRKRRSSDLNDVDIIEKLKGIVSKRRHVPSRKLWQQAENVLQQSYEITDKKIDEAIKKIIKAVNAVTLTCSTRFKVKLDIVEFALGEK